MDWRFSRKKTIGSWNCFLFGNCLRKHKSEGYSSR